MGSTTITVRNHRPAIEAGHIYQIVDDREQPRSGDFHIVIEVYEDSDVKIGRVWLRIGNLATVNVLEITQVAS